MIDRTSHASKGSLLMAAMVLTMAAPGADALSGCSSSNGTSGHDGGGGGGSASGTGGGGAGGAGSGGGGGLSDAGSGGGAGSTDAAVDGGIGGAGASPDGPAARPTITAITPSSAHVGDPSFTLMVDGRDFPASARVSFDGNIFNTAVVSSTHLEAEIPSAALGATPRQVSVLVTRISGSSPNSNTVPFEILPAPDGG